MGRPTVFGAPSSNKRDVVLAAAVRCFAHRGTGNTSIRDIARGAGLTEGTLYHYFRSKDALIKAAFQWSAFQASDVHSIMGRNGTPLRERLLAVGGDFLAALRRRPEWTRVVIREALRAPAGGDKVPIRSALLPLAAERTRALAVALRGEFAARWGAPRDAARTADLFFQALLGHFVSEAIARAEPRTRAAADPFLVHLIDTIVAPLEARQVRKAAGARRGGSRRPP